MGPIDGRRFLLVTHRSSVGLRWTDFMRDVFIQWLDQRTGIPTLSQKICTWSVPACRGGCRYVPTMIVFAFLLQAITGILLWTHYSPSALSAWESLFYIQYILPGGWMIRGIHHYSGQLLTALLGFYLLGLVLRGAYRSPREFVFWCVLVLLLFSLASSLTGDLLTWTLSGFSATLVRVRFLQMLPWVGDALFRIVAGAPEFGTLTIPRFLVLHILVFGGGFFAVMLLWRFFDYRAAAIACETSNGDEENAPAVACPTRWTPFWSGEFLKSSLACLLFILAVLGLVYQKPILHALRPGSVALNEALPKEASVGAHLGAPADPADFYDAARPEWSFRALYHFCNLKMKGPDGDVDVFPGERKFLAIFVIPPLVFLYLFLIPVIGHSKPGHYINIALTLALFAAFCYLTCASYHHDYIDPSMADFRADKAKADRMAERAVELCLAPEGIPPTGALTLLARDPMLQGPALYEWHCAICHPFAPMDGDPEHPDFQAIACETPSAPNLYDPIRKKWIAGFFDAKRIRSENYFGKTKFVSGTMVGYVRGELKDILEEDEENEKLLDDLVALLTEDAALDRPRTETAGGVDGLSAEQLDLFPTFNCGQCHRVYAQDGKPVIQAPDLRGYLSRDWMIGIIADPASTRFYGPEVPPNKGNDRMNSFHPAQGEATMSMEEIETVVDWLRGKWYRFEKRTPAEAVTEDVETKKVESTEETAETKS